VEGGERGVEGRDGEVRADDEAFERLRLRLGRNSHVSCHSLRRGPLARAEAGVEALIVPACAAVEGCQATGEGERVVGRIDRAMNAAIRNGAYDGEAVDKTLDEVPVQMPSAHNEGGHVARVDTGRDPGHRGWHQGVDGDRDGAASVGEGGHAGHALRAESGQGRSLLQRGTNGALRLVGQRCGPQS
jgi:hypothetical protein